MASLTSGSWTVRLLHASGAAANGNYMGVDTSRTNRHKIVDAILTLTTGEQPAAGIPWPDKGAFGFVRNLDSIILTNTFPYSTATFPPSSASGKVLVAQSNATAGKIKFLQMSQATGATLRSLKNLATTIAIPGGAKLYVQARGW
jgi:hypothetical protein